MATERGSEKKTLTDALDEVKKLDSVRFSDRQLCIEAPSLSVQYRTNFDTNFEDRTAYVTGVARYTEEATVHADLNLLLEQGRDFCAMLYTWRCCTRGIPQVKSNQQENRMDIYKTIIEILEPKISKLSEFMHFQRTATERFCVEVKRLCHKEKKNDFVSEAYLLTLGKFVNMFAVLDELKNMKSSISNDVAAYRRATKCVNVLTDINTLQESDNLSLFFASQNVIKNSLKGTLITINGFEELLSAVINICVRMYENKMYIEPKEKHMLVKVIAFGLFIIDHGDTSIYDLDHKGKLCISKIDKILKQLQVVPLYGDMQVIPFQYIKNSRHFDASKWPHCGDGHVSPQANILSLLEPARTEHQAYISKLAIHRNKTSSPNHIYTENEDKVLYELALKGIHLLSTWTQHVVELNSWKLMNPTDPEKNAACPSDAEEYERATRYNYNSEEKFAVSELIAMVKGLQRLMLQMESTLTDGIRRHVYREIQTLVQRSLRRTLRRSVKGKHDVIHIIIMSVRDTCADWLNGEPRDDPSLKGQKDSSKTTLPEIPKRNVGPSTTQLYMVRTMLESLIGEKSATGSKALRKHLDPKEIELISIFHRNSFFWSYLLNFNESIQYSCDLSQLWYREFYLEMTMGRRIQFPIEISMPWILTDHILDSQDPFMIQYLLYPLDLYNDSALYALTFFKQQFLYDEIEAEVDLCFDQFVYKLSHQIVTYYKQRATIILLDKRFQAECLDAGMEVLAPSKNGYEPLLQQRNVRLLGRSVDLNHLIRQRVNAALIDSLDVAISIFESGDLTDIVELQGLIECNKLTHRLLKKYLALNDFDDMMREANQTMTSPYGRIMLHVFWCLYKDFLPHYSFNTSTNRFVKTKHETSEDYQRDTTTHSSHPYAWGSNAPLFTKLYGRYSAFIGSPHFSAMSRLLGYQNFAVLIEQLLKVITDNVKGPLLGHVQDLIQLLPRHCNLLLYGYGSPGILRYYMVQMEEILNCENLKTQVFQRFREIGNAILFCLKLESALNQEEVCDTFHAAPFLKLIPKPFIPYKERDNGEDTEKYIHTELKQLENKFMALHINGVIANFGNSKQADLIKDGEMLTRNRLCSNHSIFREILKRLRLCLEDPVWYGSPPSNGVLSVDDSVEFHRLWSAIQFVCSIPAADDDINVEQIYGDSLHWAGGVLVSLLGQQMRFEALDFCYHLSAVNDFDECDELVDGVNLRQFVCRVAANKYLNKTIFDTLNTHTQTEADKSDLLKHVIFVQPPTYEQT